MTTPPTPAGWYPDPDGSTGQRYWDGSAWTEHRAPVPSSTPPAESAPAEQAATEPPAEVPGSEQPTVIVPTRSAPPPPSDTRKLVAWYGGACAALVAVLVLAVAYALFLNDDDGAVRTEATPTTAPTAETSEASATSTPGNGWGAPAEPPGPPAGEPVDGPMAFTVHGVEVGPTVVSRDAPIEKSAQGEYVVVNMTVTNIGDLPVTFLGTLQKLKAAGNVFDIDDEATFYIGGGLAELAPGAQADVSVAFDVPPGTVPEAIELHADPISPGIEVPLT